MVPHCTEGGNSLLLRAISSQNKNISFLRKSQINTGFAWSRFYLPKKLLLSQSLHLLDEGCELRAGWNEFHACAHTSNFTHSLPVVEDCRFPSFFLFVSLSHTHTVRTTYLPTYAVWTHAIISSCLTEKLLFSMLPCISDIKEASSLTVDSGWACLTSPHCCVKFPHQWCVYLVW